MKKITEKEIGKLTMLASRGRKAKSEKLYRELLEMEVGGKMFMSKEEWKKTGYKTKTISVWLSIATTKNRKGHMGRLASAGFKFSTTSFAEGWVITRIR